MIYSNGNFFVFKIRYRGFSECIEAIQTLGLIDAEPHPMLHPNGPEITWVNIIFVVFFSTFKLNWISESHFLHTKLEATHCEYAWTDGLKYIL